MARRLGGGAETPARCVRASLGPSPPFSGYHLCSGRAVLARAPGPKKRQSPARSLLLPEIAVALSAELFFHHRAIATKTPGPGSRGGRADLRIDSAVAGGFDLGRRNSASRGRAAGPRRSSAVDRFRCLRRTGIARGLRRHRRAALATRSRAGGGALRPRRSRDRYRAPDLSAA